MDTKNLAVLQQIKDRMAEEADKPEIKPKSLTAQALLSLMTDVNLSLHGRPKKARRPKSTKAAKASPSESPRQDASLKGTRTKPKSPWPAGEVFRGTLAPREPEPASLPYGIKPIHAPGKMSRAKGGKCMFRGVHVSQAQYKALKKSLALLIYGNDHKFLKRKFDALSFYLAQAKDDHEAVEVYEKIAKMLTSGKTTKPESEVERERRNSLIKADVARTVKSLESSRRVVDKDAPEWSKRYCQWCHAEFSVHRDWAKPPARCKKCRDSLHHNNAPKNRKKDTGKTVYSHYVIYSGGSPGLGKRSS